MIWRERDPAASHWLHLLGAFTCLTCGSVFPQHRCHLEDS